MLLALAKQGMRKILITTTDTLCGWEIDTYIKPVFASIVVGAGLFADFSASISDMFGGRTGRYEKKLQGIKEDAIASLTYKATELGANCILGLKIDVDEVSGKNMQLFMVTATGMAVIARSLKSFDPSHAGGVVDKEHLIDKSNILKLAKKFQSPTTALKIEELQLIVQSRSASFKEFIIGKIKKAAYEGLNTEAGLADYLKLYKDYFLSINPQEAISMLYPVMMSDNNETLITILTNLVKEGDLVDYEYIHQMLAGDQRQRKLALNLLLSHKPSYNTTDIGVIKQLIPKIRESFPIVASVGAKKGFLSSTAQEVWICPCGGTNAVDEPRCTKCGQDQFGFKANEYTADDLIGVLTNRVAALESLL
ncbi:YbjQ family protein [Mucilaginibacter sp. L3T2-6]|uniref:YbjQ family protein n=1 Tax=Mucilaginibacter sp. L3T2-6 TaxID=3062491 RepID=UPI002675714C|nr:YbjQ family protein [Mucilaginibacter sp. L3T2-6]MDO3643916.1 YbjQ family protein [Mucilaginibacter sp. L3T2-6]MDV6216361.1 YbjQ family protein [Mucilaginibacter sp. L3T2-6]